MTWLTVSLGRSAHEAIPQSLCSMETRIMSKLNELTGQLDSVTAQLLKSHAEIIARIGELSEALNDIELPEGAVTALNDLKLIAQALDDINPDVPSPAADPSA